MSLPAKVATLARSPQFFWFLGHASSTLLFVLFQVIQFFNQKVASTLYRLILVSEIVSYAIVVKQLHIRVGAGFGALKDENVQYLALALGLLVASFKLGTWPKALYSFAVFSVFHAASYFQSHLLEAMPMSLASQAAWSDRITYISANYNQQALFFAAMTEVFLLTDFILVVPVLLFKLFLDPIYVVFQAGLIVMIMTFIKLRYVYSTCTQMIVAQLDARVTGLLSHPVVPPSLLALYSVQFKEVVRRISAMVPVPVVSNKKKE